ncbi:carbohydrate esterase family 5 protein [Teratosphaeria destructans]|uniref:Cutinase n=1 Tax=Teratosphaeria destructans TaxID=418781 RepID=A0A9W7SWY5_9PEZI|nr:carbohydrate esterase family 5 protein [Teratosphaeria destructans]
MRLSPILTTLLPLCLGAPTHLVARQKSSRTTYSGGGTASDVQRGVCAPITVLFARGTSEMGNIGSVIGPPLFSALVRLTNGNIALQGLNYAAGFEGDFTLGSSDGPKMTQLARQTLQQCPSTKIVMSGYSQGCLVIHNSLNSGQLSNNGGVVAVLYFGDPLYNKARSGSLPASKIKSYCASGDGVCLSGGFSITAGHLSYGSDAQQAAQWIIQTYDSRDATLGRPWSVVGEDHVDHAQPNQNTYQGRQGEMVAGIPESHFAGDATGGGQA